MVEQQIGFSPDGTPRRITYANRERVQAGGLEIKYLLFDGGGKSYMEREYSQDLVDNWQALRRAGLPVVSEMLVNKAEKKIFVPDLKNDGSEIYGRSWDLCFRYPHFNTFHRRNRTVDTHFLALTTPDAFPALTKEVQRHVTITNAHGFRLPDDDAFDLLVHPDGSSKLVLLDIRNAVTSPPNSARERISRARENDRLATQFVGYIERIRGHILSGKETIDG